MRRTAIRIAIWTLACIYTGMVIACRQIDALRGLR